MKNKLTVFTAIFLVISIGTYFTTISDGSVSTVEFVSLLAIGMLMGVLLTQIIQIFTNKKVK
jgi:hypothetical protein